MKLSAKYVGYLNASSGMGNAARNIIMALDAAKVGVVPESAANLDSSKNLGQSQERLANLPLIEDYQFKILHLTPDELTKHLEPMKKHIFHFFWETTRVPEWFVWSLNMCDEVWTGCEWNRACFKNSGVKTPIWTCPQPVEVPAEVKPFEITDRPKFMFYSVFQWIERKDPKTLLTAFWEEFAGNQDVGLMIKAHGLNYNNEATQKIVNDIITWKAEAGAAKFPRVYLYTGEMNQADVFRFHQSGDCFVSAHRGEGFGIPQAEAMGLGKPVISTDLGGVHEWVPKDYFYGVNFKLIDVFNMDWVPWYDSSQQWAQASKADLRAKMRQVYENQDQARAKAKEAKSFVERNFSFEVVGKKMRKRLQELGRK